MKAGTGAEAPPGPTFRRPGSTSESRQFYLTYPDWEICYTACSKLSWSHNRLIMRGEDPKARACDLAEGAAQQWTVRQLERNIQSRSFQRLLSSQAKAEASVAANLESVGDFIKDPYVLEFLQLPESARLRERALEQAIIDELQKFLLELGKGFSFVARQMRIKRAISSLPPTSSGCCRPKHSAPPPHGQHALTRASRDADCAGRRRLAAGLRGRVEGLRASGW